MATEDEREIYRQTISESERNSYRLEWQMFQVGTAIGLVTLGLGDSYAFKPEWWQLLYRWCCVCKVFLRHAAHRTKDTETNRICTTIKYGYASLVGDSTIDECRSNPWMSAAVRSRLILHTVGVILVFVGYCKGVRNAYCIATTGCKLS